MKGIREHDGNSGAPLLSKKNFNGCPTNACYSHKSKTKAKTLNLREQLSNYIQPLRLFTDPVFKSFQKMSFCFLSVIVSLC